MAKMATTMKDLKGLRRWALLAAGVTLMSALALGLGASEASACRNPCGNEWASPDPPSYLGPNVTAVSPQGGATGVSRGTNAKVTFSEAMDPASINTSTLQLRYYDVWCPTRYPDPYNPCYFSLHQISATVSKDPNDLSGRTWVIDPEGLLYANRNYMVRVTTGVRDIEDGLSISSNKEWYFKTGSY